MSDTNAMTAALDAAAAPAPKAEAKPKGKKAPAKMDPREAALHQPIIAVKPGQPGRAAKPAPVPAKKAAKPAPKAVPTAATERRKPYSNEATIHVLATKHEIRGLRGTAIDCLKDGQTVEQFKAALAKKEKAGANRLSTYTGWALQTALDMKLISIRE